MASRRKINLMRSTLALCAMALAGCAAQKPAWTSGAELMAADPSNQCYQRMTAQLAKGPLEKKISLGAPPTLEMVLDKTSPNDEEKSALSQWSTMRQQCAEIGRTYRVSNLPGPVVLAIDEGTSATTLLIAKLYSGEMTYGQFNVARDENASRFRAKLVEYDRHANQAQAQANADEAARRQAAGLAVLQGMQIQQAIQAQQPVQPIYQPVAPAFRAPTTTNCQRWGNQVNCTTY